MKKLFLTTAIVIAAFGSAQAQQNAPSLGDRIKTNWENKVDRNSWMEPVAADQSPVAAEPMTNGKKMHKMTKAQKAAKKAEWDKMTPEQKAAKKADNKAKAAAATPDEKAKMKAERKAKWDKLTPEQKAAWKAKHAAKKGAVAPAPAAH